MKPRILVVALVAALAVVAVLAAMLIFAGGEDEPGPAAGEPVLFSKIDQDAWRSDLVAVQVDPAAIDLERLYADVLKACKMSESDLSTALATASPDTGISAEDVLRVNLAHVCPSRVGVLEDAIGG